MNDAQQLQVEEKLKVLVIEILKKLTEFLPTIPPEHRAQFVDFTTSYIESLSNHVPSLLETLQQEVEETRQQIQNRQDEYDRRITALEQRTATERRARQRVNGRGRKPGKRKLPINDWAREQYTAGKTIDELLPEYAEKRKMRDLVQARELLRKAIK